MNDNGIGINTLAVALAEVLAEGKSTEELVRLIQFLQLLLNAVKTYTLH